MNAFTNLPETNTAACDETILLTAMAHPARLQVLQALANKGEMQAADLNALTSLGQSAFSQHLRVLRDAGLVDTRRKSQRIYYSLRRHQGSELLSTMFTLYG